MDTMLSQAQQAEAEIGELKEQLRQKTAEMDALQDKFEKLKLAKTLSGDSEQKRDAKLMIHKMLREVDRCIALLNR